MAFRLVLNEFSLCTMGNFNHDCLIKDGAKKYQEMIKKLKNKGYWEFVMARPSVYFSNIIR